MAPNYIRHNINGAELKLLPEKAIYWPDKTAMMIADLHIGKIMHFRKNGIPIPQEAASINLDSLSYLLLNHEVTDLYLLGDLFHSAVNVEWLEFANLRMLFKNISFHLIIGNHDFIKTDYYKKYDICLYKTLALDPFYLSHLPLTSPHRKYYNLCGHIHPGIKLKGRGKQSLRLPCYYFTPYQGVLPAFGSFTGLGIIKAKKVDSIFAIADSNVIRID